MEGLEGGSMEGGAGGRRAEAGKEALHEDLIARFKSSAAPERQALCAVAGAIAQVLKDQALPFTPTAYFAAAMSSLDRQCSGDLPWPQDPVTTALCAFLVEVLPKTPLPILRSKSRSSLALLLRISGNDRLPPGALKYAFSCIALILAAVDKSDWPNIAPVFHVLATHCLDRRPKVRKRAHQCTAEVFSQLKGSSQSHCQASDTILTLFEQSVVAVIGNTGAETDESKTRALQVIYFLNALKLLLPVMAAKSVGKIVAHFSTLLDVGQVFLTREVLNTMKPLLMTQTAEIPAKSLADVIGKLAALLNSDTKTADESIVIASVLLYGMERLYAADRNACVQKFSTVFHSVARLLASEHEGVVFGASECLKSLIQMCVDQSMIQQGVNRSKLVGESWSPKPTPIEKVCAIADSVLGYQYTDSWDTSLQVIATLFDKLGESSAVLMAGILKTLVDLQKLPDKNIKCRKQLHRTFGAAVAAMGPDQFLSLLPLEMDTEDLSNSQLWILPILKQNIIGAKLKYFAESILPLASRLRERSLKSAADGRMVAARNYESCVQSLWALLPSFCNYPQDTAENFRLIAKPLGDAINKDVELRGIACHSLQILIGQNRVACGSITSSKCERLTEDSVVNKAAAERAKECYTANAASTNLLAIGSFARNFLPLLFNVFIASSVGKRGDLQATIEEFASISDRKTIRDFFVAIMQKLLKATKDANEVSRTKSYTPMEIIGPNKEESATSRRCVFMDLALSLIQGLDEESIILLFAAIKPAIQDVEGSVQKKGYKVLASLCKEHVGFLSKRSDEILELLVGAMPSCHLSAKRHRLNCLLYLLLHLFKSNEPKSEAVLSSFIGEVILATKESNSKTRNAAYDLLVQVGHSLTDSGLYEEKFLQFFHMIVGCLAGTTPHMISAAVTGIARLIYEFPDLCSTIPHLMPSILLLLQSKSREVIKSVLGFIKVASARQPVTDLQQHLGDMIRGLLLWSGDTKNHFKAKVRMILKMLVRRCGIHAVSSVMPEQHRKLLSDIQKKERRNNRNKVQEDNNLEDSKSTISFASTARRSKWNHTQFFSDVDPEEEDDHLDFRTSTLGKNTSVSKSRATTSRSSRKSKGARRLMDDSNVVGAEPLDLLDLNKTRAALSIGSIQKVKRKGDDFDSIQKVKRKGDDFDIAPDGRMIVPDDGYHVNFNKRRRDGQEQEGIGGDSDSKSVKTTSILSQRQLHKTKKLGDKRKKLETGWAYTGSEYGNKKGSRGDMKKKGKLEPYAYWPLDPKMLNRRGEKQAAARRGLANVVKVTKKMQGMNVTKALKFNSNTGKRRHKLHKGKRKNNQN